MRFSRLSVVIGCAIFLLSFGVFSLAGMGVAPADGVGEPAAPVQDHVTYLPVTSHRPVVFDPASDRVLPGGAYTFISMTIRSGVTVSATGDLRITVLGDAEIAGALTADCTSIDVLARGNLTVTGVVDNECSGDPTDAGDLSLYSDGGDVAIGTADTPATLRTSGGLDAGNDPYAAEWEYEVLPHQRSASALAPVCAATTDTLVDSVFPGSGMEVAFTGEGADPDGGPVIYEWAFGDGETATGRDPVHVYDQDGVYDVALTVTDDDGQTCMATLRVVLDDGGQTGQPEVPAVAAEPQRLVVGSGEAAYFVGEAEDAAGDEIAATRWEVGGVVAGGRVMTTTFGATGRYEATLTVTDTNGFASTATASVYVYDSAAAPELAAPAQGDCMTPGRNVFNVVHDGGTAAENRRGRRARFRGQGHVFLGSGTNIQAQDGGDGEDRSGSGRIIGRPGRRGGSLMILVRGSLTVCGGARLAAGDGGEGGMATSTTPAPQTAYARGGNGGRAAPRLWIATTQGLSFEAVGGASVVMDPGSGGDGGDADADGLDGADRCPRGQDGADAKARGGKGGRASKTVIVWGNVMGLGNVEVQGGMGGDGGFGDAFAGDGGEAVCQTAATGGDAGWADATGGEGGDADLAGAFAPVTLAPDAFTAGDGGYAVATSGDGGNGVATPSAACEDTTAEGGAGADAEAIGGQGGSGRIDGGGGDGDADSGFGGDATATGGDCPGCGNEGGSATATAGDAGDATARYGRGAPNGDASAVANDGGWATATGGAGGDCDECPGGAGGPGGAATATGGDGGDAAGNGNLMGGDGGDGDATGGDGGDGADCCAEPGGNGGDGGAASSTAGDMGTPGGVEGANATRGGNGGDGGDGKAPGDGGAGGAGDGNPDDIPDGEDGMGGDLCADLWFIYHSSIGDGSIAPGTTIVLSTYITASTTFTPTGQVPAYFMTQEDGGFDFLPSYNKNENLLTVQGGLQYDLSGVPPSEFPVDSAQVTVEHTCQFEGCLQLRGQTTEGDFLFVGNEMTTTASGPPVMETLRLPFQPSEGPYYQQFGVVIFDPTAFFVFDHWAIVIIDP